MERLSRLAAAAGDLLVGVEGAPGTVVSGVAYDSRDVMPGDLFFCVVGATSDGHRFAPAAEAAGAAALCVQRRVASDLPQMVVSDVRKAMGRISAAFLGNPGAELELFCVTGTNGKTTTAYLMDSILRAEGLTTGLIGTIETRVAGRIRPGVRTTPESADLQKLLAEMRSAGAGAVVMEVTSHALALNRVEGLTYEAAAFTNLSQDHLDFHADMEDYFEAKRSLFVPERIKAGAVNVDDPYGRKIKETAEVACIGFGMSPDADVRARNVSFSPGGTELIIEATGELGDGDMPLSTSLVGAFNVSNCLAAASLGFAGGMTSAAVRRGIEALEAVPGRFETIDRGQPFMVVVDYAHTPDSLDNVLREARRLARRTGPSPGRVLCAFGCGGDRDRGKRPLMGAVAALRSDVVVVTSDNPRSEDPIAIIDQILEGVVAERAGGADAVIPDRAEAIAYTVGAARAGDVVVIAGKGHETGQELAGRKTPFDDRAVAAAILEGRPL